MKQQERKQSRGVSSARADAEQPLLRALVAEAGRRGDTLASMAKSLGVTYERLAQWRRGEGSIATARKGVHEKAAKYLGVPTVFVMTMAGQIRLEEFIWPSRGSLHERIVREIERMRQNNYVGSFMPQELDSAPDAVKLFAIFLFHELEGETGSERARYRWMSALHRAVVGDVRGQQELLALRAEQETSSGLF